MHGPLDHVTPHQIRRAAQITAATVALGLVLGYVTNLLMPVTAGLGTFLLSCALLLAAPRQRATEMLSAIAVWQCFAELLSTLQTGDFQIGRLVVSLMMLGTGICIVRVQHLRQLMRHSPQAKIADLEQRTVGGITVLPRTDAQLAEMRKERAT